MRVAIVGYGIEGQQSCQYWLERGDAVTILDERDELDREVPEGVTTILGDDAMMSLDTFDMVVRTAGLSPHKLQTHTKVWSATNEFFLRCEAPIIGVTGSKGKGTTSSLIASILRAAGHTVHLVGNIGVPALGVLPEITSNHLVVYELSSFQLWDAERSPHKAVVLHIEADHLDVHADFAEYIAAKANIVKYQSRSDVCVYHPTNQWSQSIAENQPQFTTHAAKYGTPENTNPVLETVFVEGDNFVTTKGRVICAVAVLKLPGAHNIENACAAMSVCLSYGVTNEQFANGLAAFTGLPHRLKFVREVGGSEYYDDSIATTPGSAIAAIKSFAHAPTKVLLLGGHEKGADYTELIDVCKKERVVVIAYGANRNALKMLCDQADVQCYVEPGDMNEVVKQAHEHVGAGGVVLLSPAAASFDMFKNYADRGDQFISAVQSL